MDEQGVDLALYPVESGVELGVERGIEKGARYRERCGERFVVVDHTAPHTQHLRHPAQCSGLQQTLDWDILIILVEDNADMITVIQSLYLDSHFSPSDSCWKS